MVPFAHLDRPFDYLVPASMAADAVPGARVRVRFAGRLVDGFVLDRVDRSEHGGRLAPLAKVISPEPVLSRPVARLARAVADRYAGTLADVLRLAVPPRHAAVEKGGAAKAGTAKASAAKAQAAKTDAATTDRTTAGARQAPVERAAASESGAGASGAGEAILAAAGAAGEGDEAGEAHPGDPAPPADAGEWRRYPAGPSLLAALAAGRSPRAVWWAPPGPAWPAMVAAAVRATLAGGRGALVIVPDHRDADRVADALTADLGPSAGLVVSLRADLGPAERYRRFLAARRGRARVVVGTRAAVFAPVERLGLVVVWDDGDDLHAEPRAPYPHTRDVAVLRSRLEESALLVGGHVPSTDAEALTRSGWAHPLVLPRGEARQLAPLVRPTGSDWEVARDEAARSARLPSLAVRAAREALAAGRPVLVQVPRRGYQPSLACSSCRRPARCPHCHGPLGRPGGGRVPGCRWCGRPTVDWACPGCSGTALRASVSGDRRTAEELGRAFPGVTLRTSGRDEVLATVPASPALVIATPGAEPVADGGYGAVLLLDGWALLGRPDLRAGEETLRRWANAAALAVAGPAGGRVVVVADEGLAPVQALLRWDPAGFVAREADDRAELGFPPATRIAAVEGAAPTLRAFLDAAALPATVDVLGPVPLPAPARRVGSAAPPAAAGGPGAPGLDGGSATGGGDGADEARERLLVRVPRKQGGELADALRAARGVLDARRAAAGLRVQLDPLSLG
ncbi:preprotein translocase subunit SecA [Pseudofrankia asymbiotica]|uniref:Probable replication restart protein PriA n=2 Tax=Pseudofrankia asymbiotica TaxID=1834516 RepID=A0A1V2IA55_9ACTN|nr:preprotein translocase subunit SecA [Pseudofrankia asymbiotica]